MVLSKDTNTVLLSDLLRSDTRYSESCNQLTTLLDKHAIAYQFIDGTKDIWCRDYMLVQTGDNQFVQFRYEPSYLNDALELRSDPREICEVNGINVKFSDINLDGGNLVSWSDRVILTERVFDENQEYSNKSKLISEIEKLLEAEVIVIPQIKSDMTGHADGLVRFVDGNTLIGNDRNTEYKYWVKRMNNILAAYGLDYIDIPFFEFKSRSYKHNAIGCYVNFLEVSDLIVVPVFEVSGNRDKEVVELFKSIYPARTIEAINFNQIGLHGGLLNCTTWTIKQ